MPLTDITAFVAELDHCISYILLSVFFNLIMYIIYPHFTVNFSTEKKNLFNSVQYSSNQKFCSDMTY